MGGEPDQPISPRVRVRAIHVVFAEDTGDWVGLYSDGKLVAQGHSFSEREVLEHLGIPFRFVRANVEATGYELPENIGAVQRWEE